MNISFHNFKSFCILLSAFTACIPQTCLEIVLLLNDYPTFITFNGLTFQIFALFLLAICRETFSLLIEKSRNNQKISIIQGKLSLSHV